MRRIFRGARVFRKENAAEEPSAAADFPPSEIETAIQACARK